jgi:glutamine amidotransferase
MERNKKMIAVIDYGAGNLGSVTNAIGRLGYQLKVTRNPEEVLKAKAVFLPGVGAAGDTVASLERLGMIDAIWQLTRDNRPLFAICVGLQILLSLTEEGGPHKCLGIIPGRVRRLPEGLKIPHMGWNQVRQKVKHPIFDGVPNEANFYFVHSYYAEPEDKEVVAGTTEYGLSICCMIIKSNLIATQFHPEKSGEWGLKMYSNFLNLALDGRKV